MRDVRHGSEKVLCMSILETMHTVCQSNEGKSVWPCWYAEDTILAWNSIIGANRMSSVSSQGP